MMQTKIKKRKPLPDHWYRYYSEECVSCGAGSSWKERILAINEPKPKNSEDRYYLIQSLCYQCRMQ